MEGVVQKANILIIQATELRFEIGYDETVQRVYDIIMTIDRIDSVCNEMKSDMFAVVAGIMFTERQQLQKFISEIIEKEKESALYDETFIWLSVFDLALDRMQGYLIAVESADFQPDLGLLQDFIHELEVLQSYGTRYASTGTLRRLKKGRKDMESILHAAYGDSIKDIIDICQRKSTETKISTPAEKEEKVDEVANEHMQSLRRDILLKIAGLGASKDIDVLLYNAFSIHLESVCYYDTLKGIKDQELLEMIQETLLSYERFLERKINKKI